MVRQRILTQERFEAARFALLPAAWVGRVGRLFSERKAVDLRAGNLFLLDQTERFERIVIPLGASDADVRAIADAKARELFALACAVPVSSVQRTRAMLADAVRRLGIDPPEGEDVTPAGAVARMTDRQWWRRVLRRTHARELEAAAIGFGFVHSADQPYASDQTVKRRGQQKRRNAATLADTVAINEEGDAFTLAELAARSVANPEIRRGELMTRIKGFEEVASGLGHAADFWTITCPSRMHAKKHGGADNPVYDGTTPREAQQYLGRVWGRIRAALHRREIGIYGFRIAEPHHDGTPHWHMLVFMPAESVAEVRAIVRRYAMADSGDEAGASGYRCKFVAIRADKGTAAGYIAKYVAKNIDGYRVESDLLGNDAIIASQRVEAWASTWGIRQFQQVGGPPVGVWRELRRMREGLEKGPEGEGASIEEARAAADAGNWRRYVEVMGGPVCKRSARPLALEYGPARSVNPVTGEIVEARTRYGEPAPKRPVGVWEVWSGRVVSAVRHLWRIVSKAGAAIFAPWTRVNNCTEVDDGKEDSGAAGTGQDGEGGQHVPQGRGSGQSGGHAGGHCGRSGGAEAGAEG